ncbi:MAG: hypothetical protein FWH26_06390 [Oscillospiraceae bacterium]|nr:hypothetical protein [Oscillospiraceae bacterium]
MEYQATRTPAVNAPSLHYLRCPDCRSDQLKILGKKGAVGKSIAVGAAFGAVGAMVASSNSESDFSFEPSYFKCESCKKKFESLPLMAQPEELLAAPCKIVFKRSGFYGWAVAYGVWINGVKVCSIKSGKTVEFSTITKYNTLFLTDMYGVAFKKGGVKKFEAQPGGIVEVEFKGAKFKK